MIITAFGHRARQGKDVCGEAIVNYYAAQASTAYKHSVKHGGPRVTLCKFARALYKECEDVYGMVGKDPLLLQKVGVERREEDENYWVKRAFDSIPTGTDIVIFTDVRFQNEAERIKKEGGYLVDVVRLNDDGTRFYANDRPSDHISETDLSGYNWDYRLTAKTGESALLAEQAITLAEYIRGLHA